MEELLKKAADHMLKIVEDKEAVNTEKIAAARVIHDMYAAGEHIKQAGKVVEGLDNTSKKLLDQAKKAERRQPWEEDEE